MAEKRIGRLRDLPEPGRIAFAAWLAEWRKACPLLEGLPDDEQDAYYTSDYAYFRTMHASGE